MQTITLSTYRFARAADAAWGFLQMQMARGPLARTPGIGFHKLFGSGSGASFHPKPNFYVWGILAAWPDRQTADRALATGPVFRSFADRAAESFTAVLTPVHAAGSWDGQQPFDVTRSATPPSPIGILTRATIKPSSVLSFWRDVPGVSASLLERGGAQFAIGLGEVPWFHQVTVSIWPDVPTMHRFAYAAGPHAEAIRHAKAKGWFKEDLFARFRVDSTTGTWDGRAVPASRPEPVAAPTLSS
jgi:spheroidene monooxygenase